jgi:hypothetical protein
MKTGVRIFIKDCQRKTPAKIKCSGLSFHEWRRGLVNVQGFCESRLEPSLGLTSEPRIGTGYVTVGKADDVAHNGAKDFVLVGYSTKMPRRWR